MQTVNDYLEQQIYELKKQVKDINYTIARIFETETITADMIAQALDDNTDPQNYQDLKTIYCSWGGNPRDNTDAVARFTKILNVIRSYQ